MNRREFIAMLLASTAIPAAIIWNDRPLCFIVFEGLPLEDYGNSIPQVAYDYFHTARMCSYDESVPVKLMPKPGPGVIF